MDEITNNKAESSKSKRKPVQPLKQHSKQRKIEKNDIENINFELEERKIAFKERELQIQSQEVANRKALAEAEALEIANLEKKKALGLL